MNLKSDESITLLYKRLQDCDGEMETQLWNYFFPRLHSFAQSISRQSSSVDPDDVAQSAMISFFRRGANLGLTSHNRSELWSLLVKITVRKVRKHVRHQQALKRGGGRVVQLSAVTQDDSMPSEELIAEVAVQQGIAVCHELLDILRNHSASLMRIAEFRLLGLTNDEIANELEVSRSTVERKFALIRKLWEQELELDHDIGAT